MFAYIDPGTGSYLLQILLAGALGGALAIKIFWKRIKIFFAGLFGKKDASASAERQASDQSPPDGTPKA